MASAVRSVRSKTSPNQRRPARQDDSKRPQLSLIEGGRSSAAESTESMGQRARNVVSWASDRSTPLVHFVTACVFVGLCLLGSLFLRTQMVQNSFEASTVQRSISQLSQDVQDDQNKLDELQASLPSKAQEMGMVPQQGSNSVDLKDYRPSELMQVPSLDKTQRSAVPQSNPAPSGQEGSR